MKHDMNIQFFQLHWTKWKMHCFTKCFTATIVFNILSWNLQILVKMFEIIWIGKKMFHWWFKSAIKPHICQLFHFSLPSPTSRTFYVLHITCLILKYNLFNLQCVILPNQRGIFTHYLIWKWFSYLKVHLSYFMVCRTSSWLLENINIFLSGVLLIFSKKEHK